MRYNKGINQYTEKQMRARVGRLRFKLWRSGGIDILLTHAPASGLNDGTDKAHNTGTIDERGKWNVHLGQARLDIRRGLREVITQLGHLV